MQMDRQTENDQMRAAGFVFDPTWQGYTRWTHDTKGITCLRSPYMTDAQWEQRMAEKIAETAQ
jgi:hypothetical protein